MTRGEKIILAILLGGILALFIGVVSRPQTILAAGTPEPEAVEPPPAPQFGPAFLSYNMPYAFSAPVFNFLPAKVAGNISAMVNSPSQGQQCGVCD